MKIPNTMRAIEVTQPGGPEVLKIGTRPVPQPKAGEVLIRVAAAGVNRPDTMQRAGNYPVPPGASDIPGLELAGGIVALGEGVRDWRVGDTVTAFGHKVFATAGSAEKCAACAKLGADRTIGYKTEDFVAAVKEATAGRGVDVILDMVGGDYIDRELKSLADDGRIVIIAFLGGAKATLYLTDILRRRLTVTGSALRPRSVEFKGAIARNLREKVWPLIEAGKIKAIIHKTFPLAEASKAHALMESSAHIGKIVLTV